MGTLAQCWLEARLGKRVRARLPDGKYVAGTLVAIDPDSATVDTSDDGDHITLLLVSLAHVTYWHDLQGDRPV